MERLLSILIFLFAALHPISAQNPRVFVLTDIENEPDDAMSFVRFLVYSNQFDIEGIVATTSCWQRSKTAEWRLHEIATAYGQIKENLEVHEKGFPSEAYIHSVIKKGLPVFGKEGLGKGKDSEGSDWLVKSLLKLDDRPLYIQAWGGTNVLAQALWKLQQTESQKKLSQIISKMRVYAISDQDDTGPWIRKTFPELFYIVSPGFEENGGGQYHYATWTGISGDNFHGRFLGPDSVLVGNKCLDENVRIGHGALGAKYPRVSFLMEGDSPSFLGAIQNGLNDPEHPNYGGWGGRYELYIPSYKKYMYEPETRAIWTDTQDEVYSPITKSYHTSNHATIWRWREAFQNDFFSRMDWCINNNYSRANHPPKVTLNHSNTVACKAGEELTLSAQAIDPDNNSLAYRWLYYKEVGSINASQFNLPDPTSNEVRFRAPSVEHAGTMHFILEVTDNGSPKLTRYQRVIVVVNP